MKLYLGIGNEEFDFFGTKKTNDQLKKSYVTTNNYFEHSITTTGRFYETWAWGNFPDKFIINRIRMDSRGYTRLPGEWNQIRFLNKKDRKNSGLFFEL